jgi:hypothetical protein
LRKSSPKKRRSLRKSTMPTKTRSPIRLMRERTTSPNAAEGTRSQVQKCSRKRKLVKSLMRDRARRTNGKTTVERRFLREAVKSGR